MSPSARQILSKKLRFEIFKRDNFACQYCGNHPPEIILEVDHINPASNGGENDPDNLITSCFNCNRGKAANLLTSVPQSLRDKAYEVQEREEQIQGYQAIMQARRDRIEAEVFHILRPFLNDDGSVKRDYFNGTKRFIERLGYDEVYEAMEIALGARISYGKKYKYFCGVCWNKINRNANG